MSAFGPPAVETVAELLWGVAAADEGDEVKFTEQDTAIRDQFRAMAAPWLTLIAFANREHLTDQLAQAMRNGHPDDGSELDSAIRLEAERYVAWIYGGPSREASRGDR